MRINRYSIPKLPRNKYSYASVISGGNGGQTVINNESGASTPIYDGLDSNSIDMALSANQGKVLNEKIIDVNDRAVKLNNCINLTSLANATFINLKQAIDWLALNKDVYKYDTHPGMTIKFKSRSINEWLTFIYVGTDLNYLNPANWKLHIKEQVINVIDNLTTDDPKNALSARQGKILNEIKPTKTVDETISGKYDFTNGLKTKSIDLNDGPITSTDFDDEYNHGTSIYPLKIKDEAGTIIDTKWNMTIDNLKVRDTLDVFTLQIEEARAIAGAIYCTKAGMKVSKVGEDKNIWRCYFNDKDEEGNVVKYQQFRTGDFAFCQIFDGKNVKHYWYKVTGTNLDDPNWEGEPFIDLKKPEFFQAVNTPAVGDEIIQLGNTTDPERQGAMIIEPLQLSVYNDINSTKLPKPIIRLSPKNTKIDADLIEFIGKTMINGNFIVDTEGNLTVKGHIEANTGNIGRFDINDKGLFNDADAKGLGQITIQDKTRGIGFKLGTDYDTLLTTCYITNDKKTALKADSDEGVALIAGHENNFTESEAQSERIGLKVYNGAELLGMKLASRTCASDTTLSIKKDDIIFMTPTDGNKVVTLPVPKQGKIFTIHNSSEYVVRVTKTWLRDKYGKDVTDDYYRLNKGETLNICAVTNQYYYIY